MDATFPRGIEGISFGEPSSNKEKVGLKDRFRQILQKVSLRRREGTVISAKEPELSAAETQTHIEVEDPVFMELARPFNEFYEKIKNDSTIPEEDKYKHFMMGIREIGLDPQVRNPEYGQPYYDKVHQLWLKSHTLSPKQEVQL